MPWFNVDDGFAWHQKVIRAGNAAIGLWTRAGSWSAHQLTEGFIPADIVASLGTSTQAQRLVSAGLWAQVEGGYQFHEWAADGRNPTREQVLERRRKDRDKKAAARAARHSQSQQTEDPQLEDVRPLGTDEGIPEGLPLGFPRGVGSTTPLHSLKENTPNGVRVTAPAEITPGVVVGAWVDAYQKSTGNSPSGSMRSQVGRESKKLLDGDCDPRLLLEAATAAGGKGFATVERQYAPLAARRNLRDTERRDPSTGRAVDW